MEKKKIILVVFGLFLINLVCAVPNLGSIPPIPDHFYGTVIIDGNNTSAGTQINVYVGGILEENYNMTQAGQYNLYVNAGSIGEVIEFKISDKSAGTSTRQGGETVYLNLAITTTSTETTTTTSSGGGGGSSGGGGGGGSSVSSVTTPITSSQSDSSEPETGDSTEIQEAEQTSEKISPSITGAVTNFLKSEKNLTIIGALVLIVIGAMLIKFKPRKWKRN